MESMLSIHKNALDSYIVAFHDFHLVYKSKGKIVYGFVEGKDDLSFYQTHIDQNLPNDWEINLIQTKNKSSIIKIFLKMDWKEYNSKRICFFVDRDFSNFLEEGLPMAHNFYITECYSIENEVVNSKVLQLVIKNIFGISEVNQFNICNLKKNFDDSLFLFQETMIVVMSQLIIWSSDGMNPTFDRIDPEEFFIFTSGCLSLKKQFSTELSRLNYLSEILKLPISSNEELIQMKHKFQSKDGQKKFICGKYLLLFFLRFLKETLNLIRKSGQKYTEKLSIGPKNIMIVVSQYIKCSPYLRDFIIKNYHAYIQDVISYKAEETITE